MKNFWKTTAPALGLVLTICIASFLTIEWIDNASEPKTITVYEPRIVTKPVIETQVRTVTVPKVVTKEVIKEVTKEVEVPVTEYVTQYVTDEAAMNAQYVSGYEDGRIEGEDWQQSVFQRSLTTPCPTEDSDNCYWNAATMGNGDGTSFVIVNGTVYPLNG